MSDLKKVQKRAESTMKSKQSMPAEQGEANALLSPVNVVPLPTIQPEEAIMPMKPIRGVPPRQDKEQAINAMNPRRELPVPLEEEGEEGQEAFEIQPSDALPPSSINKKRNGQDSSDNQSASAVSGGEGYACVDARTTNALPSALSLMGHQARQLWDIQKARIMAGNRVSAMERDGFPEQWIAPMRKQVLILEQVEKDTGRQMERHAKKHFMADWILAQRGVGLGGFARIMGITGSLDNFATVSKLWKYLGMSVDDGAAPKRKKGERVHYSTQGRTLCHQLGDSIVKVGAGGPYREAYDVKKKYYEEQRLDWTQAHRHNAAMRYAVKLFLKNMWVEWRRLQTIIDSQQRYEPPPYIARSVV